MMTNLELAKQLLFMIDTESSVQNMVLVNAVARLLDEPDEKAQDETDPEESEQKPEEPERKEAEKKKPKKAAKKQIDWGKAGACLKAGWPVSKIADELGCSEAAIYAHFKKYGGGGQIMEVHKKNELDKLEDYLIYKRITYERFDEDEERDEIGRILKCDRHQICVPEDGKGCRWDAICQRGSYGHEKGLLEIYGELIVEEDGDSVKGYLTADDVIKRIEAKK